jgi:hypothetical protein
MEILLCSDAEFCVLGDISDHGNLERASGGIRKNIANCSPNTASVPAVSTLDQLARVLGLYRNALRVSKTAFALLS